MNITIPDITPAAAEAMRVISDMQRDRDRGVLALIATQLEILARTTRDAPDELREAWDLVIEDTVARLEKLNEESEV